MAMMCKRIVQIDFTKPIGPQTPVYRHYPCEPQQPSIAIRRPKIASYMRTKALSGADDDISL